METRNEILLACHRGIRKISLSHMQLRKQLFLATLVLLNLNLSVISITNCFFGTASYLLMREIFMTSPLLTTIHMTFCHAEASVFDLLCSLPHNVTRLLIGVHQKMDLSHLLLIVSSNPQLELLWFANCKLDTPECDYEAIKKKLQACSGGKLRIIDSMWPEFYDGFFDQRI